MSTYDAVFVGAGHNALVAAAYLARAGWSVLMIERNDRPGGFVRTEELTLPGFLHDTFSSSHPLFVGGPAYAELGPELEQRGLRYLTSESPTGVSLADGSALVLSGDVGANVAEFERFAAGDGASYVDILQTFGAQAQLVFGLLGEDLTSPAGRALTAQLLRGPDGLPTPIAADLARSGRDVLCERLRSPQARALVAPWLSHFGRPVDDAGGGPWVALMLAAMAQGGYVTPAGGSGQLAVALARLVTDHGGTILTDREVVEIAVSEGAASGVRTGDGERFDATRAVVASTGPDQLYLRLLASAGDAVAPAIRDQARRFRYGGACMQVHLALSEPPRFAADERLDRSGQPSLTTDLDGLSGAINEAVRGLLPATPTISFDAPSTVDPGRAPRGQAVARLQLLDLPAHPHGDAAGEIDVGDGGWDEDVLERFADRAVEIAGRHIPNLPGAVLGRAIVGPRELSAFNPNSGPGGDPYGGRHDLAQSYLLRPLPGAPSHATPVDKLYMLGAATWPGHGVGGGSGRIVARMLLDG
jgi:phytoene dehydrogenase-like protein